MNARSKGKRGELEWAKYCRENFGVSNAARTAQFQGKGSKGDVVSFAGTHCEVKRDERRPVQDAVVQAVRDAAEGVVPYVAHRRNGEEWLITLRACDLKRFCFLAGQGDGVKAASGGGSDGGGR